MQMHRLTRHAEDVSLRSG